MDNIKKTIPTGNKKCINAVYISSYLPRKCGIATFTDDLVSAIDKLCATNPAEIIAMTDPGQTYEYPKKVKFQINQYRKDDYIAAAEYINKSKIDVVSLQHEFGLYTGPESSYTCCLSAGAKQEENYNGNIENGYYLLSMLDIITKPIITTFHTILSEPNDQQMYIARRIIEQSAVVIAMTEVSRQSLIDLYDCPAEKVVVISHGVPDFDYNHVEKWQKKLGINNASPMILTAGLLGPGKELEYVIDAMPSILKKAPNAKLFIVGQTHPVIIKNDGEVYREKLTNLVKLNDVVDSVEFVNHYLTDADLRDYFQAADFFVTAYSNMQQSASGTLAWALGSGKICISTPYQYARELLSDGAGVLVEQKNTSAIAKSITDIYNDPVRADQIREKAYDKGHRHIWANVATEYVNLFNNVLKKGK
ncbi:hypothetical protein COV88_03360 [Candidatus Saccharibacteria bacterium CG11_big_fil_rev_8_21_14_0_20_41_19]|nr:glycosyltransferase [Candidatus Saccharibacteria bacterium]OIP86108.1 MAG: hypothetical protein AUK57_01390 [Candidatus Saccharibacteria bacterium CG2_30_41_52]PIQ70633.1 MAG: hypothetical protein COV88_03360 [Candidatus Saccharibacteria bacterium CG11_big_fil_rev_8_21_14_0_20_41_19]PIZ60548.1 MAG: hypothetical protein COY18_01065 [Candidatus Saccharibacteria bacterium CG_4_10_14_0_2_um_filter_41_11]PJC29529.1 MAG: hypothetical protein CO052_02890 [Candidatus Saccharibacteria bacterium CG_4_